MRKRSKVFLIAIVFAIIASILVVFLAGCKVNPAAERTCKILWEEKTKVFLENDNLTINERELWIINVLQSLKYTDEQIMKELTAIRNYYGWQASNKHLNTNDEANKPQSRPQLE